MLGTSFPALVFIRVCIFGLRAVTPIAMTSTLLSALVPGRWLPLARALPKPVQAWFVAETLFYTCWYLPWKRRLEKPAVHPPPRPPAQRRALFAKCHESIGSPERYLSGWFHGADPADIRRENLAEFLAWAFLDRDVVPVDGSDEAAELADYVAEFETTLGRQLPSGYNPAVKSLRLTLDPVKMTHRSLLWYFMVHFVDVLTSCRLAFRGLKLYATAGWFRIFPGRLHAWFFSSGVSSPSKDFSYWYRPHTSAAATAGRLPVVFLHGLGIGLYPYVPFLSEVAKEVGGDAGIIAVEIMPISMRICNDPLKPSEFSQQMLQILKFHGIDRFVLVGHSYGTVLSTHLLHCPEIGPMIDSIVLTDPIVFLLHLPSVAYNFTSRPPRSANERQLNYFASLDPGIAHTICRHFFWMQNILWKEELEGRKCAVALSGRDLLVDSRAIWKYLTEGEDVVTAAAAGAGEADEVEGNLVLAKQGGAEAGEGGRGENSQHMAMKVFWYGTCDHAQMFDTPKRRARLVKTVGEFSNSAGSA